MCTRAFFQATLFYSKHTQAQLPPPSFAMLRFTRLSGLASSIASRYSARTISSSQVLCLDMDFDKVKKALEDGSVTLIDVRKPEEHKEERIPGAKNLPIDDIESALKLSEGDFESKYGFAKPGTGSHIVTHCKMGGRAGKACAKLTELGFGHVDTYSGSLKDWIAKGGETQKN